MWKVFPSDARYEVSSGGEVRRASTLRIRAPSTTPTGYRVIVLSVPGKKHCGVYLHRMVMETFVGPCPEGEEVSHINGDRADNRLDNLVYETRKANHARKVRHGTDFNGARNPAAKLTCGCVLKIRDDTRSETQVAADYGVSRATIGRIRRGESWKR